MNQTLGFIGLGLAGGLLFVVMAVLTIVCIIPAGAAVLVFIITKGTIHDPNARKYEMGNPYNKVQKL